MIGDSLRNEPIRASVHVHMRVDLLYAGASCAAIYGKSAALHAAKLGGMPLDAGAVAALERELRAAP